MWLLVFIDIYKKIQQIFLLYNTSKDGARDRVLVGIREKQKVL